MFTEKDLLNIYKELRKGTSRALLAEAYGVHVNTITRINLGEKHWRLPNIEYPIVGDGPKRTYTEEELMPYYLDKSVILAAIKVLKETWSIRDSIQITGLSNYHLNCINHGNNGYRIKEEQYPILCKHRRNKEIKESNLPVNKLAKKFNLTEDTIITIKRRGGS